MVSKYVEMAMKSGSIFTVPGLRIAIRLSGFGVHSYSK